MDVSFYPSTDLVRLFLVERMFLNSLVKCVFEVSKVSYVGLI